MEFERIRFLDFVHRPVFSQKNKTFWKLDLQVKMKVDLLCWVSYKELASITGQIGATFILPEDGNRSNFQNIVFFEKTLDDGQSPKT
jgi:hypothetical protein